MKIIDRIETKRLLIREFKTEDIIDIHEYASDPIVSKYVPWGPNTMEETKEFVFQCIRQQNDKNRKDFELVVIERSIDKLIGACGIHISNEENREGWIGYSLNSKFWEKGYATEIAKELLKVGFKNFKLYRIFATCHPENIGSEKVLKKIGMKKEGHLRKHLLYKGSWRDSLLYAILEDEYGQ